VVGGGLRLAPASADASWAVELRLTEMGRGSEMHAVAPAAGETAVEANRATIPHEGIEEWYVDGPLGVEQGFAVRDRPIGEEGTVVLEVTVSGGLAPSLHGSGHYVSLLLPGGTPVLRHSDLFAHDARGQALPATLAVDGERIRIAIDDTDARYPLSVDPLVWGERRKIAASSGQSHDELGVAVALSGDRALVGAPFALPGGAAFVFERDQGGLESWGERKKLVASDAEVKDQLGFAVALSTDTALVGAFGEDGNGDARGAVYLFERAQGGKDNWGELLKQTASDTENGDQYGYSVALDGDTAVVGAPFEDGIGTDHGAAYVLDMRRHANGDSCLASSECLSGHCVDGVCCSSACVGGADDCEACSKAAGGSADGTCTARADGAGCDDGAWCNGADSCSLGSCTGHVGDPCGAKVGDADDDCSESCDETADDCVASDPDGADCDDGLHCNGTDGCAAGQCSAHAGDPCAANVGDADDDCSESCDETADDCVASDPDGSACADGLYCNGTEACLNGTCGGSTGDPCAANVGDVDTDCSESCDEQTASCTANDPNGSTCANGKNSCEDGSCRAPAGAACTEPSECVTGYCVDALCCAAPGCLPYRCGAGGICLGSCTTNGDCAPGNVCTADGRCLPPAAAAAGDTTAGCGCRLGSRRSAPASAALGALLGALLFAARRRGRSPVGSTHRVRAPTSSARPPAARTA
jgi:hypothetical protein